jgi:hypothetical protein
VNLNISREISVTSFKTGYHGAWHDEVSLKIWTLALRLCIPLKKRNKISPSMAELNLILLKADLVHGVQIFNCASGIKQLSVVLIACGIFGSSYVRVYKFPKSF